MTSLLIGHLSMISLSLVTGHVIHGEELLYLFRFRNPTTRTIVDVEDEEGMTVREIMTSLWTNVAKYG